MSAILSAILLPVVTFCAAFVVNLIRKAAGAAGWVTTLLVPVLGGVISWLGQLSGASGLPWEIGLVVSLGSVFIKSLMDGLTKP